MRMTRIVLAAAVCSASIATISSTAGADGQAVQPERVVDTRSGLGAPSGRLDPGETLVLPLAEANGADAVALNLTATDAAGDGYLTAWPCGASPPVTSVLNFVPGRTSANFIAIGVGDGGVCVAASASVHVAGDLMGVFTGTSDFRGAAPSRLLDTRATGDRLSAGEEHRLSIAGGVGAVAVNVTVVNPSADGYVTAYPCGPRPNASTVNFRAGEIVPNFTLVPVSGGQICLYSSAGTDLVVDRFGSSTNADALALTSPARLLDTRSNVGTASGAASPSNTVHLRVAGRGSVPNDASAALVTITATGGRADGFVTAWPCNQSRPNASVLNLRPGLLGSNLALVKLADDGTVCLYAYTVDGSSVHLVVDGVGSLPGGPDRPPAPPDPAPPAPPPAGGHFATLPPGSPLPGDADCAALVRPAPEIRAQNVSYNNTPGHATAPNPPFANYFGRVNGSFTGTTDEIIQWTACKWGIDEDVVRAQAAKETYWSQINVGDFTGDPNNCVPGHPIGADGRPGLCPESIGMMQTRYPFLQPYINDLIASTSFNLDLTYAIWRECYEGHETWLGGSYGAGDMWGCVGRWFSGRWYEGGAQGYIADIQNTYLGPRIWETQEFIHYYD